jgi:CRP-like cAMP-binding protein
VSSNGHNENVRLLTEHPIFQHLDERQIAELSQIGRTLKYTEKDWVVHYGDVWPYFFLLKSGTIHAVKESAEGRALVVVTFRSSEVFWGLAFFQPDIPMIVSLQAGEDSELLVWHRDDLVPLLIENGRVTWELARIMLERMLRASDIVEDLAFHSVPGRLARMILEYYKDAEGKPVLRDLTLDEMAARIGTTREMVCRGLYRFMDEGAIQISRTELMIKDRALLEDLAEAAKS